MEIEQLLELEEIRQLKYRYQRGIDTCDLDLLRSCFSENVTASYSDGRYRPEGREALLKFIAEAMDPTVWGSHIAVHPEIRFIDEYHAEGIWRMENTVHFTTPNPAMKHVDIRGGAELLGAGYYHDRYVKENGDWKICHTGYRLIFERIGEFQGQLTLGDECERGVAGELRGKAV